MIKLKKVQITCPNCKNEFKYNKNALEKRIKNLGQRISELQQGLKRLKSTGKENDKSYFQTKRKLDIYTELVNDYKLERETMKDLEDKTMYENFKLATKEIVGEETYKRIMEKAIIYSQAYDCEHFMKQWY